MNFRITPEQTAAFGEYLRFEERSWNTIEKYLRHVRNFSQWLDSRDVTRERVSQWKEQLSCSGYSAVTVNGALAALHCFFSFSGWEGCRVKYCRIQRKIFRDTNRELTQKEYCRLVHTAEESGNRRLSLLLETICATGIRVSELKNITIEAVQRGRATIALKGKIRTILIPGKLCRKLLKYARKQKIASGELFVTKSGSSISRRQIWAEMKRLCKDAGVEPGKVFPHNLRHLFARAFYQASRDLVRLADILGHSSIETTRIYLITTGEEQAKQLDRLGLVL